MRAVMWPFLRRQDRIIDSLIQPPRVLHVGFDESLRKRTEARRQTAAQIRQDAARFESNGIRNNKFQVVK